MKPTFLGVSDAPLLVVAAGTVKYTNNRIGKDHEAFKKIIGRHWFERDSKGKSRPPSFKWHKVITPKYFHHNFSHTDPKTAKISIKRKHTSDKGGLYKVSVKMPHPTKEGKHIYNRHVWTSNPEKHLDRMLKEARWSHENNKQFRSNHHMIAKAQELSNVPER